MKIISFAWTTPALLAGRKTRTRREWNDDYARTFRVGDLVQAWDKSPRTKNLKRHPPIIPKRVGIICIEGIKKEDISLMPFEDFEREGFQYLAEKGELIWGDDPESAFNSWREAGGSYWVVDFHKLPWEAVKS